MAGRLGITAAEAALGISRLIEAGLLARRSDGRLVATEAQITTADKEMTTAAHRKRQDQVLEKARQSLKKDPIEIRNHSAMTMAIDPALIPEARQRVEAFTQKLCTFLESGAKKEVYELAIQLFPLTRSTKEETI